MFSPIANRRLLLVLTIFTLCFVLFSFAASAEVITGTSSYISVITDLSDTVADGMPTVLTAIASILAGMLMLGIGLRLVRRSSRTN